MNPFEEELKNRFKDAASTDGIDPDMIWEGLSNALPAPEPIVAPDKNRSNRFLYFSLVFLLLSSIALLLFYLSKKETPTAVAGSNEIDPNTEQLVNTSEVGVSEDSKANKELIRDKDNKINSTIKDHSKSKVSDLQNNNLRNSEIDKVALNKNSNESKTKRQEKIKTNNNLNTNRIVPLPNEVVSSKANNPKTAQPSSVKQIKKGTNKQNVVESAVYTGYNTTQKLTTLLLPVLESKIPVFDFENIKDARLNPVIIPVSKKGRNRNIQVGVFAGAIAWSDYFQKNDQAGFKQLLKESHGNYPGQSFSLEVRWDVSKKLHLTTGVEYLNSRTKFETVQVSDSFMTINNNVVDAIAIRTVKHHNQQKVISLPIMLGTSKDFGAFELGINTGVGLNYFISQKGKSLNAENIISEYDQDDNNLVPYQQFFLSYQVQPFLNYQATERFTLQLRPSFRYQRHGDSGFYGVGVSSLVWGISVGGVAGF